MANEERYKEQIGHQDGPKPYEHFIREGERLTKSLVERRYTENIGGLRAIHDLRVDYALSIASLENTDQIVRVGKMLDSLSALVGDQALIAALEE